MKKLLLPIWPFLFLIDLLLLHFNWDWLEKLDKLQCGIVGHGKSYKKTGYCKLCGYGIETYLREH